MSYLKKNEDVGSPIGDSVKTIWGDGFPYAQSFLCLLGFSITLRMFFPGRMSSDSIDQFAQALGFSFSDWHPPVMAFIWALINDWIPGPFGMLLLHSFLYWMAFFLFSVSLRPVDKSLSLVVIALGFTPFAIGTLGSIWKDVFHATLTLFAVSLAFYAAQNVSSRIRSLSIISFSLLVLAALARFNALAALPPLMWLIFGRPDMRDWRFSGTIIFLIPILIVLLGMMANYGFLRATKTGVHSSLLVFDLGGMSHYSKTNLLGDVITDQNEQRFINGCYTPDYWNNYAWGDCSFVTKALRDSGDWGSPVLLSKWKYAVSRFPGSYIEHRWTHWRYFLTHGSYILQPGTDTNPWGYEFKKNGMYRTMERLTDILKDTIIYKPGFWLIAAIALFGIGLATPKGVPRDFVIALNLSAILYLCSYLIVGVASDFRYAYWSILATLVSFPILCSSFFQSGRKYCLPDIYLRDR